MKSFQTQFCAEHGCEEDDFQKRVFWECLYRHAISLVPLLGGFRGDLFVADRTLISCVGRAENLEQVRSEITDFFMDADNRGFLRKSINLRVSTSRLRRLAKRYLPGAEPHSHVATLASEHG